MAIIDNKNAIHIDPYNTSCTTVNVYQTEHNIQGEMITVSHSMSDVVYTDTMISPNEIKKLLVTALVEKMFDSNKIEFTKVLDASTLTHMFRARIFVVPDTQVRILREKRI